MNHTPAGAIIPQAQLDAAEVVLHSFYTRTNDNHGEVLRLIKLQPFLFYQQGGRTPAEQRLLLKEFLAFTMMQGVTYPPPQ